MSDELELYLHYEKMIEQLQQVIREEQKLIRYLTIENINLKQIISETETRRRMTKPTGQVWRRSRAIWDM